MFFTVFRLSRISWNFQADFKLGMKVVTLINTEVHHMELGIIVMVLINGQVLANGQVH